MNSSRRFFVKSLSAALGAVLALVIAGCASTESSDAGSSSTASSSGGGGGSTVKVVLDSTPTAAIIINDVDLGMTPVTVNVEVDEGGFLMYPVKITWDYNKAGGRGTNTQNWTIGKNPPAKVSYTSGILTEAREAAPRNAPGVKRSFDRL